MSKIKDINDEIQRNISYIKDELQISIEENVPEGRKQEIILVAWLLTEAIAHYGSYGKTLKNKEQNFRKHDISY